jgi:hypothetical protein
MNLTKFNSFNNRDNREKGDNLMVLRAYALTAFILFCFLLSSSAQRFIGGVTAGINLTQVDGDQIFGYHKVGFNGGPFVKLMLDKKQRFSVTMELLYSQKGAQKKYPGPNRYEACHAFGDTAFFDPRYPAYDKKFFYKLRTDYLEIPIVFHYDDPRSKVSIGVGIAWSRLVYVKESLHDYTVFDSANIRIGGALRIDQLKDPGRYKKNDWSIIADVKIPIYKGLKFNFRFQYSLAPFGKVREFYSLSPNFDGYIKRWPFHNTLTFRIIYSFNEKYTENTNYDREGKRIGPKWIRDPEAMKW